MNPEEIARYDRQIILPLWGIDAQEKIKSGKVLVIGAGGLGCPVLSYLAAAGVGTIGIMDFDIVEVSNLQRQVIYNMNDIGINKATVALQKLKEFNPLINLVSIESMLISNNALEIIAGYDIVVDATDNFETRYLINDSCIILNKPFVFASIIGFEGQVSVFNYKDGPTYRCLYPEAPSNGAALNCNENGVIGVLAGIMGCMQANEVLKIISGVGDTLSGKLLRMDLLKNTFSTFYITSIAENKKIKTLGTYNIACKDESIKFISKNNFIEYFRKNPHISIDVSDEHEFVPIEIGSENIPLYEIENWDYNKKNIPIILYCKNGIRSRQAAMILSGKGIKNLYCLKNN